MVGGNEQLKEKQKDITAFIKEWMFKSFRDEKYNTIKNDFESGKILRYEDPYFPPNNESLGEKIVKKFKDLVWKRAPEFIESVEVLNLEKDQKVNQGRIGDCYLLNPISLLGIIQKNMIIRLFTIQEANPFGVWLFIDGKWQHISVDETFPWWTTRKKPYFCDVVGDSQIWPMIIEKAWAKLHGEYSRLWGGDTGLAFRVITGAPTQSYGLKKYRRDPRKKDFVYKQIDYHLSQGHLISVTTGALDEYGKSIMTQGHSYALIGCNKEDNKYIIRDPRGETNVFGKECVIVCVLHPKYVFTQHEMRFDDDQTKTERMIKIRVEKKMKFYLSFFQPNKRFFRSGEKQKKHRLAKMTFKVLKIDSRDGQIVRAKTLYQRCGKAQQMDMEISLAKGIYYIYSLIEWTNSDHRVINMCSYGPNYIEFEDPTSDKHLNALKEFLDIQRLKSEEQLKAKLEKKSKQNKNHANHIIKKECEAVIQIEENNSLQDSLRPIPHPQAAENAIEDTVQTGTITELNEAAEVTEKLKEENEKPRQLGNIDPVQASRINNKKPPSRKKQLMNKNIIQQQNKNSIDSFQPALPTEDQINLLQANKSSAGSDKVRYLSSDPIQTFSRSKQKNNQLIVQKEQKLQRNIFVAVDSNNDHAEKMREPTNNSTLGITVNSLKTIAESNICVHQKQSEEDQTGVRGKENSDLKPSLFRANQPLQYPFMQKFLTQGLANLRVKEHPLHSIQQYRQERISLQQSQKYLGIGEGKTFPLIQMSPNPQKIGPRMQMQGAPYVYRPEQRLQSIINAPSQELSQSTSGEQPNTELTTAWKLKGLPQQTPVKFGQYVFGRGQILQFPELKVVNQPAKDNSRYSFKQNGQKMYKNGSLKGP